MISGGRVAAEGTPRELKSRLGETMIVLQYPTAEAATTAASHLAGDGAHTIAGQPTEVVVPLRVGASTVRRLLNELAALGDEPSRFDLREPTLDDVFLDLTADRS